MAVVREPRDVGLVGRSVAERGVRLLHGVRRSESRASGLEDGEVLNTYIRNILLIYLGRHYIFRHGYHTNTKNGMYSRTCLVPELYCCIPNLNNS